MSVRSSVRLPLADPGARYEFVMRSGNRERRLDLGGRGAIGLMLAGLVLLMLYIGSTLYMIARDDLVIALIAGQRRSVDAYEDRIAELRQRIDRINARQVLNQDSIEDRVAGLVARQAELEARQIVVADVTARANKSGLALTKPGEETSLPFGATGTALPFASQPGKPRPLDPVAPVRLGAAPLPSTRIDGVVGELDRRSGVMEEQQLAALRAVGDAASREIKRSRHMIASLGLNPQRFGKIETPPATSPVSPEPEPMVLRGVEATQESALGGPLLAPIAQRSQTELFEAEISRIERAIESAGLARHVMSAIPVGRPMPERYEQTSGFGTRLDPFTRSLALHSGIDFRAPHGTPVKAVAAGKVIEAGWSGGYGRMVEIDHGFGITTRYAHLSAIAVNEGDRIAKGGIIGQVGSTGRSTGPHLHYEVRIDEDAADPQRFIRAEWLLARE